MSKGTMNGGKKGKGGATMVGGKKGKGGATMVGGKGRGSRGGKRGR